MPEVNLRNNALINQAQGDFIRRQDHLYSAAFIPGLFRSMFGIRDFYLLNAIHRNSANIQVVTEQYGRINDLATTSLVGVIANVAKTNIINRIGHIGEMRLGRASDVALYAVTDAPNARVTGGETDIIAAERGYYVFAALRHPAGYTVPVAPVGGAASVHTIESKWTTLAVAQRHHILQWEYQTTTIPAGDYGLSFILSASGANVQAFYFTNLKPAAGAGIYMVGACLIPGVGCYGFMNDQWQYKTVADFSNTGAVIPAALFAGTALPALARQDDAAAVANGHTDAYYRFWGWGAGLLMPDTWLSIYRAIQPVIGWNTDLGGT